MSNYGLSYYFHFELHVISVLFVVSVENPQVSLSVYWYRSLSRSKKNPWVIVLETISIAFARGRAFDRIWSKYHLRWVVFFFRFKKHITEFSLKQQIVILKRIFRRLRRQLLFILIFNQSQEWNLTLERGLGTGQFKYKGPC